jgi:hypothetical protein
MPLYTFLHDLLHVLAQIANKVGLQKQPVYLPDACNGYLGLPPSQSSPVSLGT